MDAAVRQKVYEFFARQGMRRTVQRDALIEIALGSTDHFTAESLLARARHVESTVSRATVYRTLPLLVACGVLREVELGRDEIYYDPNFNERPYHNHLICLDCQRIVEFEDAHVEMLGNCVSHRLGFSPVSKAVRIEARCDELRDRGTCRKRLMDAASAPFIAR